MLTCHFNSALPAHNIGKIIPLRGRWFDTNLWLLSLNFRWRFLLKGLLVNCMIWVVICDYFLGQVMLLHSGIIFDWILRIPKDPASWLLMHGNFIHHDVSLERITAIVKTTTMLRWVQTVMISLRLLVSIIIVIIETFHEHLRLVDSRWVVLSCLRWAMIGHLSLTNGFGDDFAVRLVADSMDWFTFLCIFIRHVSIEHLRSICAKCKVAGMGSCPWNSSIFLLRWRSVFTDLRHSIQVVSDLRWTILGHRLAHVSQPFLSELSRCPLIAFASVWTFLLKRSFTSIWVT